MQNLSEIRSSFHAKLRAISVCQIALIAFINKTMIEETFKEFFPISKLLDHETITKYPCIEQMKINRLANMIVDTPNRDHRWDQNKSGRKQNIIQEQFNQQIELHGKELQNMLEFNDYGTIKGITIYNNNLCTKICINFNMIIQRN